RGACRSPGSPRPSRSTTWPWSRSPTGRPSPRRSTPTASGGGCTTRCPATASPRSRGTPTGRCRWWRRRPSGSCRSRCRPGWPRNRSTWSARSSTMSRSERSRSERRSPRGRRVPSLRSPRVLMYHYFGDAPGADPEHLFVTEKAFAAQLEHLRRRGWTALTLDEYLAALDGAPTPRRSYLLSIGDRHESAVRVAAPVLQAAGVPSVLFVCPDRMGGTIDWNEAYAAERLAPAEELKGLPDLGMELGVHSADHTRMAGMDAAALHRHVTEARQRLEATTGVRARAFAYPYGTHDRAARAAVAAEGYDVAFAVAREHGRFAVDRVFVRSDDSMLRFAFKLSTAYRLISRVGGRAWRLRHAVRGLGARLRGSVSGRAAAVVRRVVDVV